MLTAKDNRSSLVKYFKDNFPLSIDSFNKSMPTLSMKIGKISLLIKRSIFTPLINKFLTILAISLLILNILSILHYFDKTFALGITLFVVILANWHILFKIDYGLLLTFVGFFIFIGNIQQTELVIYLKNSLLGTQLGTYLVAIGSSQFISNVPAAMLLASLTNQANALLVGVNVGGLGTLIASMASVISYKLFVFEHPYLTVTYLRSFFFYNFLGLFLIGLLSYLFFIFH